MTKRTIWDHLKQTVFISMAEIVRILEERALGSNFVT